MSCKAWHLLNQTKKEKKIEHVLSNLIGCQQSFVTNDFSLALPYVFTLTLHKENIYKYKFLVTWKIAHMYAVHLSSLICKRKKLQEDCSMHQWTNSVSGEIHELIATRSRITGK